MVILFFLPVKAFHLKFEEMKLEPNIKKWDVQVLQISRNKRHLDKANILHFWETLDRWVCRGWGTGQGRE